MFLCVLEAADTPLSWASNKGHLEVVKTLLSYPTQDKVLNLNARDLVRQPALSRFQSTPPPLEWAYFIGIGLSTRIFVNCPNFG
jgi:ankyrin repeat protein